MLLDNFPDIWQIVIYEQGFSYVANSNFDEVLIPLYN